MDQKPRVSPANPEEFDLRPPFLFRGGRKSLPTNRPTVRRMERRRSRISPLKWVIHLPRCNEETEEIERERDALNKAPDKEGKKGVREKYVKVNGKASKKCSGNTCNTAR